MLKKGISYTSESKLITTSLWGGNPIFNHYAHMLFHLVLNTVVGTGMEASSQNSINGKYLGKPCDIH